MKLTIFTLVLFSLLMPSVFSKTIDFLNIKINKASNSSKKAVSDNRGNKIELTKVSVEGKDDSFIHIKSDQKFKKEASIDNKLTQRLEAQLL